MGLGSPTSVLIRAWQYRDLVGNLLSKEIKVRYMGASLGFAWSLLNPFITIVTYLVVFTYVFKTGVTNYALFLVTGVLHWTFFANVVAQASELLVANAGLIKKIRFPWKLLVLTNVLLNLVLWMVALAIYLLLFPVLGGNFSPALLAYPFYLLLYVGFSLGISLMLAVAYVEFRDTKHLVEVVLPVLFWATPILYPLDFVPEGARNWLLISPFAEFTLIFQDLCYAGEWPSVALTAAFTLWSAASLSLGIWVFNRHVDRLVMNL
jgi:lipopolysaccharide transport system permease protein